MSYEQHQRDSSDLVARCSVITLSDTRTEQSDRSGARIRELLESHGHLCSAHHLIPDDPSRFKQLIEQMIAGDEIDVMLSNGGTGISRRDTTIEVAQRLMDRPLPGFGELFRMLSFEQIGSGAMLSRAVGGVVKDKLLFCMPGSTAAVELAMTRLILPELGHLINELKK